MNQQSTIFLNNVTAVDYAYIDDSGMIVGGSYDPKFLIYGELNGEESVDVDFSKVKKDIKRFIDDKEVGFDHKLWIIEGYSNSIVTYSEDIVKIETPYLTITGPKNILRVMKDDCESALEEFVATSLEDLHPNVKGVYLNMSNIITQSPFITSNYHQFRYTHGLKNSTNWGCQNIAHGHLSFIAAASYFMNNIELDFILQKIASELNLKMFTMKENLTDDGVIDYSCPRGYMRIDMTDVFMNEAVIALDTETTIENIVKYVADKYGDKLRRVGAHTLFVSEGLNKGSFVEL
jgi:hypothetical protein